jgi:hypothetical protein
MVSSSTTAIQRTNDRATSLHARSSICCSFYATYVLLDAEPSGWIIGGLARLDQVKQTPLKALQVDSHPRVPPLAHEPVAQGVHERLLALMTLNKEVWIN